MIDKKIFDKYFKKNDNKSITFLGTKLIVIIPDKYFNKIASITNTTVTTLGIFEGYIFDDIDEEDFSKATNKFVMKLPSEVILTPSNIDTFSIEKEDIIEETLKKENMTKLIFFQGDQFILSTSLVQNYNVIMSFLNMLFNGYMPSSLSYEDILLVWDNCNRFNGGGSLKVNITTLGSIIANIVRCPDDLSTQFRMRYERFREQGVKNGTLVRLYDLPKYTDSYSAITSADPKHGITVAIERKNEGIPEITTPIEKAIQ